MWKSRLYLAYVISHLEFVVTQVDEWGLMRVCKRYIKKISKRKKIRWETKTKIKGTKHIIYTHWGALYIIQSTILLLWLRYWSIHKHCIHFKTLRPHEWHPSTNFSPYNASKLWIYLSAQHASISSSYVLGLPESSQFHMTDINNIIYLWLW